MRFEWKGWTHWLGEVAKNIGKLFAFIFAAACCYGIYWVSLQLSDRTLFLICFAIQIVVLASLKDDEGTEIQAEECETEEPEWATEESVEKLRMEIFELNQWLRKGK